MSSTSEKTASPAPRPKSNWAQLISAATSLATVAIAVYAIFFSKTSQTLIEYLQSELSYRNQRIINLENTKDELSRSILSKETELNNLDRKYSELNYTISTLDNQKNESENQLANLKNEQTILSKLVAEARSQSALNEFSYMKERIIGSGKGVLIVTWPLTMGDDENRTQSRRETLWPQYLDFYKRSIKKFSSNEHALAERVINLFEKNCSHFSKIVFVIPAPSGATSLRAASVPDTRIEDVRKRVFRVQDEIESCLRGMKDD